MGLQSGGLGLELALCKGRIAYGRLLIRWASGNGGNLRMEVGLEQILRWRECG